MCSYHWVICLNDQWIYVEDTEDYVPEFGDWIMREFTNGIFPSQFIKSVPVITHEQIRYVY